MFTKLGEKIKAEGSRSFIVECFIYSRHYGAGGVFAALGLLWWNIYSNGKQFARILSHQAEREKWNQKAKKTILNCESIETAMLVQAQVDKSWAYEYAHLHPARFIPPKPVGAHPFLSECPFAGSMRYYMPQFFYVPQMTIINQAPPLLLYFPLVDPRLPPSMVKQIEYCFSDANLVKDDFLRSKMDEEGWVPIELISNFPSVKKFIDAVQVTDAVQFILYFLSASTLVEVQDKKVRRRDDWRKWIHTSGQFADDSGSFAPVASTDSSLQNVSSATNISNATEATDAQVEVAAGGSLSEKSTNQSKPAQEEGSAEGISSKHT